MGSGGNQQGGPTLAPPLFLLTLVGSLPVILICQPRRRGLPRRLSFEPKPMIFKLPQLKNNEIASPSICLEQLQLQLESTEESNHFPLQLVVAALAGCTRSPLLLQPHHRGHEEAAEICKSSEAAQVYCQLKSLRSFPRLQSPPPKAAATTSLS